MTDHRQRNNVELDQQRDIPAGVISKFRKAVELHQSGLLDEAEPLYRYVVKKLPANFDALHLLGLLEVQRGRPNVAVHFIQQAIKINPASVEALNHLGNAYLDLDRPEDALNCYDRAISLKEDLAPSHVNRGNALLDLRRPEQALASYDRALELEPRSATIVMNRGNALRALRRTEDAIRSYQKALEIEPDNSEALVNCGSAFGDLKQYENGIALLRRALDVHPDLATGWSHLGDMLVTLRRHEEAHAVFSKLLSVEPGYGYLRGRLLHSLLHCCEWASFSGASAEITKGVRARKRSSPPFPFLSVSDSAADQLQCSQTYVADKYPESSEPLWRGERYSHDKIRVAYLSADYHEHPTSFLIAGLIERHDRTRFETIGVSLGPDSPASRMQKRLRAAFERFIDVSGMGDPEIAETLRRLEVDILVDLGGFTQDSGTGALAWRPAPIQVAYLGYPGTLGATYVDYILADRSVIPDGCAGFYSEKIVRLPDCFQANDSTRVIADATPTRAEMGLPDGAFIFCSFNYSYKINPPIFDVWMRLLRSVPGSVLWLVGGQACVVSNLEKEAASRGIDPSRLVFAKRAPYEEYLARYRLADLFLDTLPFNAGATASDALWAGLPVLTCSGQSFAARMAGSLLSAAGLPELITHSLQDYELLALRLARVPEALADAKTKLLANRGTCPLFDTDRHRRNIERAYTEMWRRFQNGLAAESFDL